MPKISIIFPIANAYNSMRHRLKQAIPDQTFTDFQVQLIDHGAASEQISALCQKAAAEDRRFRYHRLPRRESFRVAYKKGFFESLDCQYLTYTYYRVAWHPTYLERCLGALQARPEAAAAYTFNHMTHDDGSLPSSGPGLPPLPEGHEFDLSADEPAERFLRIIAHPELYRAFFGLMRLEHILEKPNYLHQASSGDCSMFLGALSLNHPLVRLEEPLWDLQVGPNGLGSALFWGRLWPGISSPNRPHNYNLAHYLNYLKGLMHLISLSSLTPSAKDELCARTARTFLELYRPAIEKILGQTLETMERADIRQAFQGQSLPWGQYLGLDREVLVNALSSLSYAKNFLPEFPGLNLGLARCFMQLGQRPETELALAEELVRDPNHPQALALKNGLSSASGME